jgi:hypothetical protein
MPGILDDLISLRDIINHDKHRGVTVEDHEATLTMAQGALTQIINKATETIRTVITIYNEADKAILEGKTATNLRAALVDIAQMSHSILEKEDKKSEPAPRKCSPIEALALSQMIDKLRDSTGIDGDAVQEVIDSQSMPKEDRAVSALIEIFKIADRASTGEITHPALVNKMGVIAHRAFSALRKMGESIEDTYHEILEDAIDDIADKPDSVVEIPPLNQKILDALNKIVKEAIAEKGLATQHDIDDAIESCKGWAEKKFKWEG